MNRYYKSEDRVTVISLFKTVDLLQTSILVRIMLRISRCTVRFFVN